MSIALLPNVNAQPFARVAALTVPGAYNFAAAAIDTTKGFAYFGTSTYPAMIVKIRLSDFSLVRVLALNPGEDYVNSVLVDSAAGFGYFGLGSGVVVKLRLSDLSRVGTLVMNPGEGLGPGLIDVVKGYAYFTGGYLSTTTVRGPDFLVKIRLSDLSRVGTLSLNVKQNTVWPSLIDTLGGFAYLGTNTSPGIVVRVRLSDFSLAGTLTLEEGEDGLGPSVIDSLAGYAYFGTFTNPGKIVKIRLSDFSRVATLTLSSGEGALSRGAIIDASRGYTYFAARTYVTEPEPSVIVKISLSDFSRVGALPLNLGEKNLDSAVIDIANGLAYFGTWNYQIPGIIVNVRVGEPTVTQSITIIQPTIEPKTVAQPSAVTSSIDPMLAQGIVGALVAGVLFFTALLTMRLLRKDPARKEPHSKTCQSCGFQNPQYVSKFCVRCGTSLNG